jgi:hypothetical protein
VGERVWVFGSGEVEVEEYSLSGNKWTVVAELAVGRWRLQAAVVGEQVYLLGGDGRGGVCAVVECFTAGGGCSWVGSLSSARSLHGAAVLRMSLGKLKKLK